MTVGLAFAAGLLVTLAGGETTSSNARLTVRIAAPQAVIADLTTRLNARLAARGVALEVASVSEVDLERLVGMPPDTADDAALARVWLDGRDPSRVLLFMLPRQGQRVLVRKVALTAGFDQVALAQTTYIIDRAVASLLSSEPIGVPQAEARAAVQAVLPPPPVTPPPEPAAATDPKVEAPPEGQATAESVATAEAEAVAAAAAAAAEQARFSLAAFGGVGAWSGAAAAVGRVGLEGMLERAGDAHRLGVAASAVVDPGFHVERPDGELLTRAVAVHLYATATWRVGGAGAGGIAVGPALLITRVAPTLGASTPGQPAVATPRTDLDPAIGATARWELPLGRRASVFLAAMVDVVPVRARYAATIQGQDQVLFAPWIVRPGLVLGITTGSVPR